MNTNIEMDIKAEYFCISRSLYRVYCLSLRHSQRLLDPFPIIINYIDGLLNKIKSLKTLSGGFSQQTNRHEINFDYIECYLTLHL